MRRRILRGLAWAVLSLSAFCLLLIIVAGTSTSVLRGLVDIAGERLPVQLSGVDGSLFGELRVARVRGDSGSVVYDIQGIELAMDWLCLLRSTICIERVAIEDVFVSLSDAPSTSTDVSSDSFWPPRIVLHEATVQTLLIESAGQQHTLTALALEAEVGEDAIVLESVSGQHEYASWEAAAELDPAGNWTVRLDAKAADRVIADVGGDLPRVYELSADGSFSRFDASITAPDRPELALHMQFEAGDAEPLLSARLAHGNALSERLPPGVAEWLILSGPLDIELRLKDVGPALLLQQDIDGFADGIQSLELELHAKEDDWFLDRASLGTEQQERLHASGALGILSDLRPDIAISLNDFSPPLASGLPVNSLSGDMTVSGHLQSASWSWSSAATNIVSGTVSVQIGGQLQSAEDPLLPLGDLRVLVTQENTDLAETRISYTRQALSDAIVVSESVQFGEMSWEKVSMDVTPGPDRKARVNLAGDIAGELMLTTRSTADGAKMQLAPTVLTYADQRIRVEEVVEAQWDAKTSSLGLSAFCVAWRGSRLCTESSDLGRTGSLAARVFVDESHEGQWGDDRFSVAGHGEGDLRLSWRDGEFDSASFALDLAALDVDPFIAEGTSRPLRWQRAKLQGDFHEGLSLHMALSSQDLGDLVVDLRETQGILEGSAQADGVLLAPWGDLVPELVLEEGILDAQLSIGGTWEAPVLKGAAAIRSLAAHLEGADAQLEDTQLQLLADATGLNLSGSGTLGGGRIDLSGVCCDEGLLKANFEGERIRLGLPSGLSAILSPNLDIVLDRGSADLSGLITVHEGVFEHDSPRDDGVRLSADVQRLDSADERPKRFDLTADLRAIIEPGFSLRSREIESTLGGDLRLRMNQGQPLQLYGDLRVLGGELRAYGQVLRLAEGFIGFVGDPMNPDLDLSAEREIRTENLRVGFKVQGSLSEPTLALFSDPPRSERNTLSFLVRGRGPDAGATVDSTAMALSLGASAINRSGVLSSLETIPGLSDVSIGAEGSDDDVAATISAYVGRRLFLSYGVGLYEPVNALTARLYLRSQLWLEVVSRLESSFDLYYRFDRN